MWKVTIKGLLAHKLRLALTALAIVLGVTFISGTFVLTDTLHNTFTTLFGNIYQHVDFEVRGVAAFTGNGSGAPVRKPIPQSIVDRGPREFPASPCRGVGQRLRAVRRARRQGDRHRWCPTLGVSFDPNPQLSALRLIEGGAAHNARRGRDGRGDGAEVPLRRRRPGPHPPRRSAQTFTITGIARFGTADNLAGATLAAFTLPTAQELVRRSRAFRRHQRPGQAGCRQGRVQRAIAQVLPRGVEVVTGQTVVNEQTSAIDQALSFFSTALLVFAFISLFVGGFTIFNTFSIIVGQRTRELALLRIVGASRRQVFRSVLVEAALVGLVASLVGLGFGVLGALGLEALLGGFGITIAHRPTRLRVAHRVVALLVGVGVTVVVRHQPGPARCAHPAGGGAGDHQAGHDVSSRRRFAWGALHRRARHLRAGPGVDQAGDPAGRPGGGRLCSSASAMLAPAMARPMSSGIGPSPGQDARRLGQAGAGELDAQSTPHRPDGGCPHGRPGPGVRDRRVRCIGVQVGHQQRRQGDQRRLHRHIQQRVRRLSNSVPAAAARRARGHRGVDRLQRGVRVPALAGEPHGRLDRPPSDTVILRMTAGSAGSWPPVNCSSTRRRPTPSSSRWARRWR